MAYMKDSKGRRLDSFEVAEWAGSGSAAAFVAKQAANVENSAVLVLGDSTGIGPTSLTSWPYKMTQALAALYPLRTFKYVDWNDSSQVYNAAVTVQTGTDARVFTDGATTNVSATLTSAAGAVFTPSDVGRTVSGAGIPAGTTILSWTSATSVTMSANATATASSVSITLGAYTTTIYNGSVSGSASGYPIATLTRWNLMAATTPDLVFVNYGHNSTVAVGDFFRGVHYALLKAIYERFSRAGIISVIQNPRSPSNAEYPNHVNRMRVIKTLSANLGIGVINVLDAFLDTPNWEATLLQGDGLHPNNAGNDLWTALVMKHLTSSIYAAPRTAYSEQTEFFIPATAMDVSLGTVPRGVANAAPVLLMPPNVDSGICASFNVPAHWQTYGVYIIWTTEAETLPSGSRTAIFRSLTRPVLGPYGRHKVQLDSGQTFGGTWANNQVAPGTASNRPSTVGLGTWSISTLRIVTGIAPTSSMGGIQIKRMGTELTDTLDIDAQIMGLLVVKES